MMESHSCLFVLAPVSRRERAALPRRRVRLSLLNERYSGWVRKNPMIVFTVSKFNHGGCLVQ